MIKFLVYLGVCWGPNTMTDCDISSSVVRNTDCIAALETVIKIKYSDKIINRVLMFNCEERNNPPNSLGE